MRKNLTSITVVCVLMLIFAVVVDQPAANSSLLSSESSATASYVNDAVAQIFRTFSVLYYALLASSTDASDQVDSTVISTSA